MWKISMVGCPPARVNCARDFASDRERERMCHPVIKFICGMSHMWGPTWQKFCPKKDKGRYCGFILFCGKIFYIGKWCVR